MIHKPIELSTNDYFAGYVNLASGEDLLVELENICEQSLKLFNSISDAQADFSYQPGKWTIKQLVQHLIDTERIFSYRALSFARGDQQNLPGFEEDDFADNDYSNERLWSDVIKEYALVRESTIAMFNSFSESVLDRSGQANNVNFTPRILGWVLVGHDLHHLNILKERYLFKL